MAKFIVKGATKKLTGAIAVAGSKNAGLKAFAAALLMGDEVILQNIPAIEDIARIQDLLTALGVKIEKIGDHAFSVRAAELSSTNFDSEIAKRLRSSIVLTGPILARFGRVSFPYPGGCVIGKRPIDVFLNGYKKMGAKIVEREGGAGFEITAKRLKGAEIFFRVVSVTGTETLMMAATLASGRTVLHNAALEPEIKTLADFLNQCGAEISGAGTSTIVIDGVEKLHGGTYYNPPDRIETGSFAVLGALLGKDLRVTGCLPQEVASVLDHLEAMGVKVTRGKDWLEVSRPKTLSAVDIKTHEYPGFPTDLQAPFSILLTQAKGTSLMFETVFEGRLGYIEDLKRMGAEIVAYDTHRAAFNGPAVLRGREMESPDLRAGLAFVMAASVAKGESIIHNAYIIDRGYERIEERLRAIGIDIRREA
jgi:UDP-N-acetylglucosamine 1-carboxyvinyltransferase